MAERSPFAQYKMRRLALQLRSFTVNELKAASGASTETIYGFLHDLKQKQEDLFATESLGSEGPGRPSLRYTLTARGIDFLASQNVAVAKEFNEAAFTEDPSLRPMSRKTRRSQAGVVVLKSGLHIKGEITGAQDFEIHGSVEGFIQLDQSRLTVQATADVHADIIAREVVIWGKVKGDVRAIERVEIKKDGALRGDITTARVMIEDGAYFKGSIQIDKGGVVETKEKIPKSKAAELRAATQR
jgi:cytoskeletal protein CcmA (bactofilin family)